MKSYLANSMKYLIKWGNDIIFAVHTIRKANKMNNCRNQQ